MKTIVKNMFLGLALTSSLAMSVSASQQDGMVKEGLNATLTSGMKATKSLLGTARTIYAESINPYNLGRTPVDRIVFAAAVWATCVSIQTGRDIYQFFSNQEPKKQDFFRDCFSLRKPSNTLKSLLAGTAMMFGLNAICS